jgi:hypothetical protein
VSYPSRPRRVDQKRRGGGSDNSRKCLGSTGTQGKKSTPLIQLVQTHFTADGRAVLYSDEYLVPDHFRIQVVRRRPG